MRAVVCLLALLCWGCGATPDAAPKTVDPAVGTESPEAADQDAEAPDDNRVKVLVYYRHPQLEAVVPIARKIFKLADPVDQVKQVIEQLAVAPKPDQGIAVWPESTYVREIFMLADGTVVVDFHQSFVDSLNGGTGTEGFLVFSLVDSILENFPKYDKVQVLIEGEVHETFLGHIDIESPLGIDNRLYRIVPQQLPEDEISEIELGPPEHLGEGLN